MFAAFTDARDIALEMVLLRLVPQPLERLQVAPRLLAVPLLPPLLPGSQVLPPPLNLGECYVTCTQHDRVASIVAYNITVRVKLLQVQDSHLFSPLDWASPWPEAQLLILLFTYTPDSGDHLYLTGFVVYRIMHRYVEKAFRMPTRRNPLQATDSSG